MAGETLITVVGNLTADPELRYTQNQKAVVNFTVASTPRTFDRQSNEFKDGDALFLRCTAWTDLAEHVAGSLQKGARIIVQGNLQPTSWETKEGEKRTGFQLDVVEIGPSLRFANAQVTRVTRGSGGQQQQQRQPANDPWASQPASQPPQQAASGGWPAPGAYDDETPF